MTAFDAANQYTWQANLRGSVATPAESAVVVPVTGSTRDVKVVANRMPPATPEEFAEGKVPQLEVILENHSTKGIAASEFKVGQFKLRIATRLGGTTEDHPLPLPTETSAATLTFRIGGAK